jgi:hypothetical protein
MAGYARRGCLLDVEIDEVASELHIAAVGRPAVCRFEVRENARAGERVERSSWPGLDAQQQWTALMRETVAVVCRVPAGSPP